MEDKVLQTFEISQDKFDQCNRKSTDWVKGYWNGTMDPEAKALFPYLEYLDPNQEEYLQFGADKASIRNFKQFCDKLDIDTEQVPLIYGRAHNYFSRDKSIVITFSSKTAKEDGYFHYFGTTGSKQKVLVAFNEMMSSGHFEEIKWSGRSFI